MGGGGLKMRSFNICTPHQILTRWSNQGVKDGRDMRHIWGRTAYSVGRGNLKQRNRPLRRPRHRCEDNIKMHLKETGWESMDFINLVSIGTSGGVLVNKVMKLRFK